MTATWEVAASRFTRDECIAFLATHSLVMSGVVPDSILPATIRLRGALNYVWHNQGNFDPNIAVDTEFDWAGMGYIRGGLALGGDNAKQSDVWTWCRDQYNMDPAAFLGPTFGVLRTGILIEDISSQTSPDGEPRKFYANADHDPLAGGRGGENLTTDRVVFPIGKMAAGNPGSASVDTSVMLATDNSCRLKLHRSGNEGHFLDAPVNFQAQWAAKRIQIVSAADGAGGSTVIMSADPNGFADCTAGTRIVIAGCNESLYNRSYLVNAKISPSTIRVTVDGSGGESASVNSGWVQICDRQQTVKCISMTPVVGDTTNTLFDCVFGEDFPNGRPYDGQYVNVLICHYGDRSIDQLINDIIAMPEGSRMMKINAPLSINEDANVKLRYNDCAAGGDVISFDYHWAVDEPALRAAYIRIKAGLDATNVVLDYMYQDWEGATQWYYLNTIGNQDELVAQDADPGTKTKWGFPAAECRTIGNQSAGNVGDPVTEAELKYMTMNLQFVDVANKYIDRVAGLAREIFGPQVLASNFRAGSLDGCQTRMASSHTPQGNPLMPNVMENVRPDCLAMWRRDLSLATSGLLDLSQDPPQYVGHPYINDDDDSVGYAIVENGWQFMQTGNRQFGTPILPSSYALNDVEYHPVVAGTRWLYDQMAHMFMASDGNTLAYYNNRSNDETLMEALMLELEKVFPNGHRVPVVISEPTEGQQWANAYVRSCSDSEGRLVWYYTVNPKTTVDFRQVGRDVHVDCPAPFEGQSTVINNATVFVPEGQVTSGIWVVGESGGSTEPSWCEYIRGVVAAAIEETRQAGGYVVNDFRVDETYYPAARYEDITGKAVVYVVGLAADDDSLTRSLTYSTNQPIQVSLQKKLSSSEAYGEANTYVKLEKQLRATAAKAFRNLKSRRVTHHGNVAMRDPSGSVLVFQAIRESGIFESHFSSRYVYVAEIDEDPPTPE